MIELLWHNGTTTSGTTWKMVERKIRTSQPRPFGSLKEFRLEMSARAKAWSGTIVSSSGSPEEFIKSLAAAGLFLLVNGDEK